MHLDAEQGSKVPVYSTHTHAAPVSCDNRPPAGCLMDGVTSVIY